MRSYTALIQRSRGELRSWNDQHWQPQPDMGTVEVLRKFYSNVAHGFEILEREEVVNISREERRLRPRTWLGLEVESEGFTANGAACDQGTSALLPK